MFTLSKKLSHLLKVGFYLIIPLMMASCGGDDDDHGLVEPSAGSGFFIVNEGGFGNSNTSLSFYSLETQQVTNNVFQSTNSRPLGDQSQSMTIHGTDGFVVVQNSAKIEVIDIDNFESIATISDDLISPRYFIGFDANKGYVSDWGDGFSGKVHVIDLSTHSITKTISTGSGSNEMLLRGDLLYVANAGGFGVDNTISVIDTDTDEVVNIIEVGDNPSNLELDDAGNIWILGKGHLVFDADFNIVEDESSHSWLSQLGADDNIVLTIIFDGFTFNIADDLVINNTTDRIFFTYDGAVRNLSSNDGQGSFEPFIEQSLYGLALDPTTGNLIGTEAPDFSSGGSMIFYDAAGVEVSSVTIGIGPNSVVYKN